MATAVTPPTTPKTTTSVDPLYTQALAQAKTALAASTQPIKDEQAASDQSFQTQEGNASAEAAALAKLLGPIAPEINGFYQTAAQNQEVAGQGFSQGMQDALQGNTDNLNAMLKSLNAPAQLDSHAGQAGDVLYALGGYNPGTAFAKEGAGFASAAAMLPGTALLKGQDNVTSLRNQALLADQGFQQKIAELAGKLPGDTQTNYMHLQTLSLQNKKFAESVKKDNFDKSYKIAENKLAIAKYNTGIDEFNARQTVTAAKFARQQFQQNRMYALSLQRLGISEKGLQLRVAASAFKQAHGGYTTSQVTRFNLKLDAMEVAGKATHPVNGVMPTPGFFDKNGKAVKVNPKTGLPAPGVGYKTSTNTNTYANFIKVALQKGVPIQLAIQRANTIWPETQRGDLGALAQLPAIAAQSAQQAKGDYAQMTGQTLGTSPNGVAIRWAAPASMSAQGKKVVSGVLSLAQEYLGTPYAWGGNSPTGFDCSGLAQYIYAKENIPIPRTTYDQFTSPKGLAVPKGQLEAGDLVFFKGSDSRNGLPGHVGIFIGNGMMIEAPHTGDVVKVARVNSFPGYQGARRFVH